MGQLKNIIVLLLISWHHMATVKNSSYHMASTLREIPTLGKPSSINPWALDSDAINHGKPALLA
jgi:hypothetical protein